MNAIRTRTLRRMLPGLALAALLAARAQAATLFGLVDTGELFASTNGGASWTARATLPTSDAVALVAGATSAQLLLATRSGSLYASADAGVSWAAIATVPASDVTALVAHQGTSLLFTERGAVLRSTSNGANWTAVGTLTASDVKAAARSGAFWFALTRSGSLYRSGDDGATWTAVGAVPTSHASSIVAHASGLHVLTASGDVWRSLDAGATFAAVGTLSHVGAAALVRDAGELVACLETGEAAASTDASTWTWRGTIDQLRVRALATDTPTTTGVEPSAPVGLAFRAPSPNPARGAIHLALDLERDAEVTVSLHDLAGREVARPLDREPLRAGAISREWRPAALPEGLYFLRASVAGDALTRRVVWLGAR